MNKEEGYRKGWKNEEGEEGERLVGVGGKRTKL